MKKMQMKGVWRRVGGCFLSNHACGIFRWGIKREAYRSILYFSVKLISSILFPHCLVDVDGKDVKVITEG
ncbi:hypothetical protein [Bartonella sp. CB178]|uniref:hypothetical protein n=1 Tax=Bartonella sp. CB178 TaxID=3112255 RepID=UPI00300DDB90